MAGSSRRAGVGAKSPTSSGAIRSRWTSTSPALFDVQRLLRAQVPRGRTHLDDRTACDGRFRRGRYLAWTSIEDDHTFPVKGHHLSAAALLGNEALARDFTGGPLLLARLCPVDYHRFHYPDDGRVLESYRAHGAYHSVNPVALKAKSDVLATNERHITILDTKNFGKLAYVEVGAMCVGKIVLTHTEGEFRRGDEKGYFLFGGSTVVVLGQRGVWKPDAELLEQTAPSAKPSCDLASRSPCAADRNSVD